MEEFFSPRNEKMYSKSQIYFENKNGRMTYIWTVLSFKYFCIMENMLLEISKVMNLQLSIHIKKV